MPSMSSLLRNCTFSLFLLCTFVSSRHIHRPVRHHHVRQVESPVFQAIVPTTSPAASFPSVTAGKDVIADTEEIQNGLTALLGDIWNFITSIEQRLQEIESILGNLLQPGTKTASSEGTTLSTAFSTNHLSTPVSSTESPPTPIPSSPLCYPPNGAGPLILCPPEHHTQQQQHTYTITSTSRHTITETLVYNNQSTRVQLTGTAPMAHPTATYQSQNASAVGVTITVQYASQTAPPPVSSNTTTSTLAAYSLQPTPSPYTFRADSQSNVAVYYGTTSATQTGGLLALCESPDVDIAILSFVFQFFGPQGYPSINFGPGCKSPSIAQSEQASGLMDCSELAGEIAGCQQIGKKVLVSLGGYISNTSFTSDRQAQDFAATMWNLFGGGTNSPDLRPFGPDVIVDGFDIDNENHNTSYYQTFATALRQTFAQDASRTYYLSSAPQCPMPDASIPVGAMIESDFVWVQFYNNPECNLDSTGFQSSFASWSADLSASSSTSGTPRIYIGAGAYAGAGSGYVPGSGLGTVVSEARELYVDNLGGIMLWDGSEGLANVDQYGVDYLQYAKAALQ